MDYLSNNVAVNLKRIRKSKSMSLDQVSEQTGVSKSMLAQIERGTANPSLGVLGKITSGLRIEFQELIQPPRVDCCLVTPAELVPTKEIAGQYRVWTCLPYEDTRLVEVYRIEVEPGGVYISGSHGEKTREYLAVMEGAAGLNGVGEFQKILQFDKFSMDGNLNGRIRKLFCDSDLHLIPPLSAGPAEPCSCTARTRRKDS